MQDLEFTISQYLDGDLPSAERSALEQRLETDADARAMLDEYRRLDVVVKSMPMPAVRWDVLATSISSAIDAVADERAERSYRMPAWIRSAAMPLAMAASVLIVAGVGVQLYRSHQAPTGWINPPRIIQPFNGGSSSEVAIVTDQASGPVQEEVAIGPGAAVVGGPIAVQYGQDVVFRPSHVAVASGGVPVQDRAPMSSYDME